MFTKEQLLRLANIFDNAGQVFLGIMAISPLISSVDNGKIVVILLGIIISVLSWIISLRLTKEANKL